ncbi:TrkH family potassium uptake protein [Sphingomonas qomolangmaensis]|uniref:TrkH family potassium uptake protein n=1 Tax=Sphingomonas qomolangmaensis TaxID=2918765 RepID=A0ABY5LC07_9SPHN|nr:potassium transporter TrkG [Sphingomonas qomolangmaensis]UUL83387.1 TrkH family potassium uptake protein [Sphingomonas qomolangmaensis]
MLSSIQHPARLVPLAFLFAIAVGTALLMLPFARSADASAPFLVALFTATSAVCVTGLIVVDTPTYWSTSGQGVILLLIQLGGLGIMTGATMLGLLVTRRLRLNRRLIAQAETKTLSLGDVSSVLRLILITTAVVELVIAASLALRFHFGYDQPLREALWNGAFHSISAFNNAGFARYADNVIGFALDPLVLVPLMVAVVIGGIGFPVIYELRRELFAPDKWSLHTKITLLGYAILLILGVVAVLGFEWSNPKTLGAFDLGGKLLSASFHSVVTRTAGFNSLDIAQMRPETLFVSDFLMLIGGGSAGTAGGIKVTTFFLLGIVVWAEIRGEPDPTAFGRRLSSDVQRQALTVLLLALAAISTGTLILLSVSQFDLSAILFETISAFATVGLSTGITPALPPGGQATLIVLMFIGRVGTITVATALALQRGRRPFRYPQERPIVG